MLPESPSTGAVYVISIDEFAEHFRKLNEITANSRLWPDGAERPNEIAFQLAKFVLQKFREYGYVPSRVVASAEGGIAVCIVSKGKYSDIECLNSGKLLAVNSDPNGLPVVWEVKPTDDDIAVSVARIREFIRE